jgi:hypothetical protein
MVKEKNKSKNKDDASKKDVKKALFGFLKKIFKKEKNKLDVLETDLIKGEVEVKFDWKKDITIFLVLFFIVFVITLEAYIYLSWMENKRAEEASHYLEEEIAYMQEEMMLMQDEYEKALALRDDISLASNFLNRHIYWNNFFSFLEENTLRSFYYKGFSGNISGSYTLPAVTNDVRAVGFQSSVFLSDPMALSVSVEDEEIVNESVRGPYINFDINFTLNKRIFNN